jgi:hypothetical protein
LVAFENDKRGCPWRLGPLKWQVKKRNCGSRPGENGDSPEAFKLDNVMFAKGTRKKLQVAYQYSTRSARTLFSFVIYLADERARSPPEVVQQSTFGEISI